MYKTQLHLKGYPQRYHYKKKRKRARFVVCPTPYGGTERDRTGQYRTTLSHQKIGRESGKKRAAKLYDYRWNQTNPVQPSRNKQSFYANTDLTFHQKAHATGGATNHAHGGFNAGGVQVFHLHGGDFLDLRRGHRAHLVLIRTP